ncbi:MAG: carboxypeptidase-like regulatory domain-containing protein [Bacteroides sp.]|nr:carboxypeptidase-like regulatory domain-containing protein [Bacteroides sp.]
MKIRIFCLLVITLTFFGLGAQAGVVDGVVVDENGLPLPYATVRVKGRQVAALGDSIGHFKLTDNALKSSDSIVITYIGYKPLRLSLSQAYERNKQFNMTPLAKELQEVVVKSNKKLKRRKQGKKHASGMMIATYSGDMAGETFGYEFHTPKNKKLILEKVGFYYIEGDKQLTRMKFRINVYDMSKVKSDPSAAFVNVLSKPIIFEYNYSDSDNGKFVYNLPQHIVLPRDAMVEIEFLEDLGEKILYFKSNLVGNKIWAKDLKSTFWMKNPFGAPFFFECLEIDSQ